jgi:hypothetical protein
MNFETCVQQWVSIDNQLKILNDKVKELRDKRNDLETYITKYTTNNSTNSVVKISDGKLKVVDTRVHEPLTFKYLEKSLSEIIKNESQLKIIMNHLKERRDVKIIPEIKRYYDN